MPKVPSSIPVVDNGICALPRGRRACSARPVVHYTCALLQNSGSTLQNSLPGQIMVTKVSQIMVTKVR